MLLSRAKAGDGAALGRLLERYRNYLALLARLRIGRRLQGKLDVEDLLQEVSLEAHKDVSQFRGGSEAEFLAWLAAGPGGDPVQPGAGATSAHVGATRGESGGSRPSWTDPRGRWTRS